METQVKKETDENSQMKEQHKLQAKTTVNQVIGILNLVISSYRRTLLPLVTACPTRV